MRPVQGTEFTCTSQTGAEKRLNVDPARSMYQDESRVSALDGVTDGKVSFLRQNPDLMNTPMGPVIHTLELDRRSLMLSEVVMMPDRNVNRRTDYQCIAGGPINFTAGRRF